MGELRLDLIELTDDQIKLLWKEANSWILTLREKFLENPNWQSIFQMCLTLNPAYVDIDCGLSEDIKREVSSWVKSAEIDLIYSFHDFEKTPDFEELNSTVSNLFSEGADVVKVACFAKEEEDNLIMMDLYKEHKRLVAFCMGEEGKESRVTSLFFGEKLTYAAPSAEEEVASGQITYDELYQLLNIGFEE